VRKYHTSAETELDALAEASLAVAFERMGGSTEAEVSFRFWTPAGLRTRRRRRFGALIAAGRPILVSKMPLDSEDRKVAGEWEKLASLSMLSCGCHPRPVERTEAGFVMTYAPAVDLPDILVGSDQPERVAALIGEIVGLIATMHLRHAPSASNRRYAMQLARSYVDADKLGGASCQALERAMVGPTHGDLAPWNIRYDAMTKRFTLIDWEDYRPIGIPGLDVMNLLLTLGVVVFPDVHEKGYDWLYDQVMTGDHWYALVLRRAVVRYASLTRQSARMIVDLLPFFCFWMIARIESEGRDPGVFYYAPFAAQYRARPPDWVMELPDA
jgi:hypothetical protein